MERQLKYHQFKRAIGSTPGSVMVFADIPQDSEGKILKIKMQSPYEDYATYMTQMVVGDRDVVIFEISMVISCINEMVKKQVQFAENAKAELISAEIIQTLVTAIDAKDIYTKGHSTRVAEYSVILARRLG